MPTRTESALVAVFGNPLEAQAAAKELVSNAFAGDHIHIISEAHPSASEDTEAESSHGGRCHNGHLKRWLTAVFGRASKPDGQHYGEAVRNGKAVVGVSTPDQMVPTAADILSHHSPVETVVARVAEQGRC